MKISLIIAAIIVTVAAFFGFQQKEKIKTLTTQWEDLKITAVEKNISTDPKAAFSSQRARSDGARAAREKAIADFARELAAFAKKMEEAENSDASQDPEMQKEIMGFIDTLTNLSPSDLKALVKALAADTSIEKETKRSLALMSIMMMSSENPEAALTLISEADESLGLGKNERHMLPMILSQYAAKDPTGAAAWIAENEDLLGDDVEQTKNMLITSAAKTDFTSALSIIDTLDLSEDSKPYTLLAAGVTNASKDQFLRALQDGDLSKEQRQSALRSLIISPLISEDFEAASAWLDDPNFEAADREDIIQNLNFYNVRQNPQQWLNWMGAKENQTSATQQATRQIISGWTSENYVATGEWIQSQEASPTKNTAIQAYAETLAPQEPAAAAGWAVTLPESAERTSLLFGASKITFLGGPPTTRIIIPLEVIVTSSGST